MESMNFLNNITGVYPEAISFAPGRPIEITYDVENIKVYFDTYVQYLSKEKNYSTDYIITKLFQYGRTEGFLQPLLANMLNITDRITTPQENIVVTSGAQEAMVIALRTLFSDADDVLLIPEPVYVGIVGAARLLDIDIESFDISEHGISENNLISKIEQIYKIGKKVKALYINAEFNNPVGSSLSLSQKKWLIALAQKHDFYIIEDNPYGVFSNVEKTSDTLYSLGNEKVIYIGSFSKTVFPSARVGFLCSEFLAESFTKIKSMLTLNTSAISQAIVGGVLLNCEGNLIRHCEQQIKIYQENLKHLMLELDSVFSNSSIQYKITWNRPDGGFFMIVSLPFIVEDYDLSISAKDFGVIWAPLDIFYIKEIKSNKIRLSFSYLTVDEIKEGVKRLKEFVDFRMNKLRNVK
ncbi:PLP-dependent aminotransferase family protein [Marinomonas primoryensis]|nr:PLP-dependent aminotransferase family protein [Marinomonas primoryensis]